MYVPSETGRDPIVGTKTVEVLVDPTQTGFGTDLQVFLVDPLVAVAAAQSETRLEVGNRVLAPGGLAIDVRTLVQEAVVLSLGRDVVHGRRVERPLVVIARQDGDAVDVPALEGVERDVHVLDVGVPIGQHRHRVERAIPAIGLLVFVLSEGPQAQGLCGSRLDRTLQIGRRNDVGSSSGHGRKTEGVEECDQ